MKQRDVSELLLLAAIWGASFLFMRLGAAEFGPVPLAAVRVVGASLFLLPVLAWRGEWPAMKRHWKPIFLVGLTNSAIPFLCFSYAALNLTAGLSSIFNATTPLWGALIAWVWLRDTLTPARVAGLVIGFAGVLGLAWEKASFKPGAEAVGLAVLACLAAPLLYGFSASFTKKRLTGVPPMALAAGSQLSSAVALALPGLWLWPAHAPSGGAWAAAIGLALLCTGVAYVLYFRLIAHVGPANAISVTFLVPAFAVLWGLLFLHEAVTAEMALGCVVILAGTALATGLVKPRVPARAAAAERPLP